MTAGRTNIRWLVLALIILASGVAYVLRTNVSVIGESMMTDLGMNELQLGMIFSAFAAGYAIFQFPGGIFGEKTGARFALTAAAVAWGVLTLLTALVPGSDRASVGMLLAMLIVVRFLVGVTHAPLFPVACGGVISRWFPIGSWGLPNGLSSTGLTLGAAASAPLLVWLMDMYGWRGSLLITAPVAFVFALAWWFSVRNDPADHPLVGASELALINAGRPPADDVGKQKGEWKKVIRNRDILLLTASYFCMNYVFYLFFNWFFFYLVDVKEFAPQEAGSLMAALWAIGAVGATLGGFACDRLIARFGFRWGPGGMASISLVLCGVFLVMGAVADDPYVAVILLCVCFACTQITEAAYWSTTIAISGKHAAAATGVLNTGGNVVGFIGGMLVPFTAAKLGWVTAISSGAVFAIIGAIIWLFVHGDRPMDDDRVDT
jgi:ACS family glucarate transporter-like MFS transporter